MPNKHLVIGIMGPGENASEKDCGLAYKIGKILAMENYMVLTGGRNCGVMDAALKGAKEAGGTTIGILPGEDTSEMSQYTDIPIITGMHNARNIINILSSKVVVAIGESPGTLSEIAFALKMKKPVLLLNSSIKTTQTFSRYTGKSFIRMEPFEKNKFLKRLNALILET